MQYLAITLPGGRSINPPAGIPTGGYNTVAKVVGNAITLILLVIVIFTLVMLIVGGLAWIQSGGDKQKVTQARARLTYAIVGLIVALASFFILNVIGFIFKVNLLQIG